MTTKNEVAKKETEAIAVQQKNIMEDTLCRITNLLKSKGLDVPPGYSAPNAVRGAWLILQDVKDKNDKPALEACTKASIAYALFQMVVLGLDAQKKQTYFLVYGKNLVSQTSYFGAQVLAKRGDPEIDKIVTQVVYKGDEFKFKTVDGEFTDIEHEQSFERMEKREVVGAYCIMKDRDGKARYTQVMSMEEIKVGWSKSPMRPIDDKGNLKPGSNHAKHIEEYCKKTVINRLCKNIMNSASDAYTIDLLADNAQVIAHAEAEETALLEENGNIIDIEPEEPETDPDTGEEVPSNVGSKPGF